MLKNIVVSLLLLILTLAPLRAEIKFEKVVSEVIRANDWITIRVSFTIDSEKKTSEVDTFSIGFDGNLKKNEIHAIRLDNNSFLIPESLSYKNQIGRFFISSSSITGSCPYS